MIYAGRRRTFRMDPFLGLTSQRIKDLFGIFARAAFARPRSLLFSFSPASLTSYSEHVG